MSAACPDCTATRDGRHLTHDATCPLGHAADAQIAADRAWFNGHPGAASRRRPITPAEVDELRLVGVVPDGWTVVGHVVVVPLVPGLRARRFNGVWTVPPRAAMSR